MPESTHSVYGDRCKEASRKSDSRCWEWLPKSGSDLTRQIGVGARASSYVRPSGITQDTLGKRIILRK
jgi:hypothetical protein